jgi:hypothetical protein
MRVRPASEQTDKATGAFKLSDGHRAEILGLGTRLYVRIGWSKQQDLLSAAPNRFVSADGKVTVEHGPDFETDRIVLENDSDIWTQGTIRIASNERAGRGNAS